MRAVTALRKHELKAFGEITDIAPRPYGSDRPVESMIPKTPERDRAREELPWYWRSDDNVLQPRTPIEAMRRFNQRLLGSDTEASEEAQSSQTKRKSDELKGSQCDT